MSIGGASAGGTLTELIAVGAMDAYLIKNPNVTFFRFRYNKHTNFALEAIQQPFTGAAFGQEQSITLNRTGDLIYYMYMQISLPGITGKAYQTSASQYPSQKYANPALTASTDDTVSAAIKSNYTQEKDYFAGTTEAATVGVDASGEAKDDWVCYVQSVGQRIIEEAALVIGGQRIDHLYSDYLFMWEELSGKSGKRLTEMVGKVSETTDTPIPDLIRKSSKDQTLYVPLPFFFTQSSGNALPLVSLQFHGVQVFVKFASLTSLIITAPTYTTTASGSTAVSNYVYPVKTSTSTIISDSDLRVAMDTTYVYLDIEERDRFATGSFEQLITQVQQLKQPLGTQGSTNIKLNFNHPIIELIWAVRLKVNETANNWTDFSNQTGGDPIDTACLTLNNLPRFSNRKAEYFRLVQPYQHHSNIPSYHIYCYSFALHPEEAQPSGSCNFSRIDTVELQLNSSTADAPLAAAGSATAIIYARNWNIMRYRDGLGGVAFSN